MNACGADTMPRALSIAGSDSGGGAGIQADLKTMQELGVFGMTAITAVTAQNSVGVHGIHPVPVEAIVQQIDAVLSDIGADAVKTGMLHDAEVTLAVAEAIERHRVRQLVVDPVMLAKGGSPLLLAEAVDVLASRLLPLAELVTPNIPEACALLGWQESDIRSESDMAEAARSLLRLGPANVLVKGGHLRTDQGMETCIDVLAGAAAPEPLFYRSPRADTPHTHGTGCTLSAAITAGRAQGIPLPESVRLAKAYIDAAIAHAVRTGSGIGSLRHAAHRLPGP
jgi:hydroxymethylpyrimidine/phosphomethylpyrimidine kinase